MLGTTNRCGPEFIKNSKGFGRFLKGTFSQGSAVHVNRQRQLITKQT